MMIVKNKNKKYNVVATYYQVDNYYELISYDVSGAQMGKLTFKISNSNNRQIWLNNIEVYNEYMHKGVGSALMSAFEYIAYRHRIEYIEGKYYPTNEHAKPFYDSLGYTIEKDGYETFVCKRLDLDKIKTQIEPNISNYEVVTVKEQDMSL